MSRYSIPLFSLLVCLLASCGDKALPASTCQLDYELLGAAESTRLDLLFEVEAGVIKRAVRELGVEDTASIFYRFDNPELSPSLHELDSDNDGVPDSEEGLQDSDRDGVPDWLDPDKIYYVYMVITMGGVNQ